MSLRARKKREWKPLDKSALRLLYDTVHDFKTTARHIESEITRHGIRHSTVLPVPDMRGRLHGDMWVSMKTVSHFNLGIALELMLKLLLYFRKKPMPHHHRLAQLYGALPKKDQEQLESIFQESKTSTPTGFELIAFTNRASPVPPADQPPKSRHQKSQGLLTVLR